MQWKKIICPVDYSVTSRRAMNTAASLAAQHNAPLLLVYVWDMPIAIGGQMGMDLSSMDLARAEAESTLVTWKQEAIEKGAKTVETLFATGNAWNEIVTAAEKDKLVDLIVIGTHGRTGIKRLFLGSVAEKVIRHAPCSVLVVRARS
jgi:universal stress protein A